MKALPIWWGFFMPGQRFWILDSGKPSQELSMQKPASRIQFLFALFYTLASRIPYTLMVIHNSFADFVLFLYVHMAHADGDFHETELNMVREKMPKLYHPEEIDLDLKLKEAIDEYNGFEKSDLNKLFHETFDHFKTVKFAQKYKVYIDLYDIIKADGKIVDAETKALKELKEIIDINSEVTN